MQHVEVVDERVVDDVVGAVVARGCLRVVVTHAGHQQGADLSVADEGLHRVEAVVFDGLLRVAEHGVVYADDLRVAALVRDPTHVVAAHVAASDETDIDHG